jgi:glycosyltransferase involved in cell wall biosynthesis/phospholipid N-methyltransferase
LDFKTNDAPARATSLSVLVPVYNERHLVAASLSRLKELGESPLLERVQVIVVDDCSTDRTPTVLQEFKESLVNNDDLSRMQWIFIRHERNQGKGGAIRTALKYADCELAVIHDADLEYQPRDLLRMVPLFTEQGADAVFGSRFLSSEFRRVLLFRHSLGNRLLTFLCDLASDLNLSDMETCYKMVWTSLLRSIPLESKDFRIEPELALKLAKRNVRIFEVPISYSGRTYREGKKINWQDGFLALAAIVRFSISDNICTEDQFGSEILARLRRAPRFTRWMADTIRPYVGEKVLEIGAGIGNLTMNLTPRSLYWASDINCHYLHELTKLQETRPYLRSSRVDLTAGQSFPDEHKFDTVICLNVLEHIEDDVAALRNVWAALEEGGKAIVLVPQGPGLYGSLDRVLGHCRRYDSKQLRLVAEMAGFQVREILRFNRAGSPAWWINGKLLKRTTFGLFQMKVLNALVPIFKKLDKWTPLPALSLIAILEKGSAVSSSEQTVAQQSMQIG